MRDEKGSKVQRSSVTIGGAAQVTVGGNIVGRDITVLNSGQMSSTQLNEVFRPVLDAVRTAASEKQQEAATKVASLKREVAKGAKANDGVMAKLVDGVVGLVPEAVTAVVGAFATPLL